MVQEGVAQAAQSAELPKRVSPRILRRSFATHLLADGYEGYNIRTVQQLLGHWYLRTTMIYNLHPCTEQGRLRVRSSADRLGPSLRRDLRRRSEPSDENGPAGEGARSTD